MTGVFMLHMAAFNLVICMSQSDVTCLIIGRFLNTK